MKKFMQIILIPILFIGMLLAPVNNIAKATEDESSTNVEQKENNPKIIRGRFKIVSKLDNSKVLGIKNGNIALFNDHYNDRLVWEFLHDSDTNTYMLRNVGTDEYMAWDNRSSKVVATHNIGAYYYSYRWYMSHIGNDYHSISPWDDMYKSLDVSNSNTAEGTVVTVYRNTGGDNQRFKFVEEPSLTNTEWTISSQMNNSKVLDVNMNNKNVTIDQKHSGNNQKWILEYNSSRNAYIIKNKATEEVLAWNKYQNGTNVFVTPLKNYNEHYWVLERVSPTSYIIKNYDNQNMVLDAYRGSSSSGTNIQVHARNNGDNQKWKLTTP